jgi:hypothetical protein
MSYKRGSNELEDESMRKRVMLMKQAEANLTYTEKLEAVQMKHAEVLHMMNTTLANVGKAVMKNARDIAGLKGRAVGSETKIAERSSIGMDCQT